MYFLAKLIGFLISPLIWIIIIQVVIVFIKNYPWKKRLQIINLCLLLFFTNGNISGFFLGKWEVPLVKERDLVKTCDYGIVLGGFSSYFAQSERIQFNCNSDRIMQTIKLYFNGKIKKILVTGGSGSLINQDEKESFYVREYLLNIGIPDSVIFIEDQSRNTRENALNVASHYGNDTTSFLLITSAFHMKRSLLCFENAGMQVTPYPVDYKHMPEKEKGKFLKGLVPGAGSLESWNLLMKEWVGYLREKF